MHCLSWRTALMNGILVSGTLFEWTTYAVAQGRPVADDTLGNERSRIIPLDPTVPIDLIEGGAQRGNNLFHSFREFHVEQGRGVYFTDPGVANIIGRVTGGVESQILGVLGVVGGNANLFLINPSGIIFGPSARLDVRGSFTATTATAMQFGDQGFFSASNPTAPPLLTVQPSAFLFNQLNPAPIANSSVAAAQPNPSGLPGFGLRVPEGKSLTLLGGNISMAGGGLNALGGRIEIGGLSQPGTVGLDTDGSLSFPIGVVRSDVALTNRSIIDVAAKGGGSITVNAGKLELSDSTLLAGIGRNSGSVGAQAGDITINATAIRGGESAVIGNLVGRGGVGDGGDIRITTDSLSFSNGAVLQTTTFGRGNVGNVILNARDRVVLDNSGVVSRVGSPLSSNTAAVGDGGEIRITTGSLSLTNGSQISASTFGRGNAGNVIIHASNLASLDGGSIFSNVGSINSNTTAVGNSGEIRITTGSLSLTNGAQLQTTTFGQGNAGNVIIHARDRVTLNGRNQQETPSAILSGVGAINANTTAIGNGGNIQITTNTLSLTNGALLQTATRAQGNAGNVIIQANDYVVFDDSDIFSDVGVNANQVAVGEGGDVRITTGSFTLTNGAQLQTATLGQGNAGNVIIHARDHIFIEGVNQQGFVSGILTATGAGAQGRGGDISITADSVRLADRAVINTETFNSFAGGTVTFDANTFEVTGGGRVSTATKGNGQAGNIILNVLDRITLSGVRPPNIVGNQEAASGLFANTARGSDGQGGTIQLTTGQLQVLDQARISVNSQGSGVAGNIAITASTVQLNDQARLTAETAAVDGGNITLRDVGLLLLRNGSLISTTAGTDFAGGNGGNITIDSTFIVAVLNENSDIRANAFTGSGGNVGITSRGLFGIASQPRDNPRTSDITASSERGVQGTVTITTPDVDPRRGLDALPVTIVDASAQITQTCPGAATGKSEFVVTGRGGLPSSPIEALIGDESFAGWATLDGEEKTAAIAPPLDQESVAAPPFVEAQKWIVGEDGVVQLVAVAPSSSNVQPPAICP